MTFEGSCNYDEDIDHGWRVLDGGGGRDGAGAGGSSGGSDGDLQGWIVFDGGCEEWRVSRA
jgi:hypothetical protein